MINSSSNNNIYATIVEEDKAIVSINSNYNETGTNLTVSFNILDKEYVEKNPAIIQDQLNQFLEELRDKLKGVGYDVTI
ncbi:hypothetical protein KQI86_16665 [Clostridium sp. MSJ-11]|uniref:Uncharacterized protein n=1 Tax=Clostridium mobile TaxID=2841512 RepID=A0ABS6EL60_9CLOT|nr:hypothetical protein [Clostridium mobile]MBU5485955.1 hypothetical protein [Clostridium mobile]